MPIGADPGSKKRGLEGKIFHMTHKDIKVMPNVVAGTLQLGSIQVDTLIDPEASYFFFGLLNCE